jgi:hypothetical protein
MIERAQMERLIGGLDDVAASLRQIAQAVTLQAETRACPHPPETREVVGRGTMGSAARERCTACGILIEAEP